MRSAPGDTEIEALKDRAVQAIEGMRPKLVELSRSIFAEPELKFEEHKTAEKLAAALQGIAGVTVEKGVAGLETAFTASAGGPKEGPTIAMLAEYDALPQVGHGCGHPLICTSTVGAMAGVASVIDRLPGRVEVVGTPAEEGGGGKIIMFKRGAFDHVDALYAFHPGHQNTVSPKSLGCKRVRFRFTGIAAHGAVDPHNGRSALEAVIQTFVNTNALRQFTRVDTRIHGIIEEGGTRPNIVPERCSCFFYVRSSDEQYLQELVGRVARCAEAAALATETALETTFEAEGDYRAMLPNETLSKVIRSVLEELAVEEIEDIPYFPASNDIGNLSHEVPAAKFALKICGAEVPMHSRAFGEAAMTGRGWEAMVTAAKVQALTAIEVLSRPALLERIKEEFRAHRG